MKRFLSLACICFLMLPFAIPCSAQSATLYYYIEDDHAVITDFESPCEISLEIPAEIDGYPVTKIGDAAFSFCTVLTEVIIPDTVTYIDDDAFVNCTALKKVHIPEGVHTIWEDAFSSCTSLTEVVLPESLKVLGNFAFCGCTNLKQINIPKGLTSMGVAAFGDCTALTEISLPGSLNRVEVSTFSGCTGLEKVQLSEGITEIGETAFFCCSNLTEITFPASVTQIGNMIVTYTGVQEMKFLGDAPSFSEESFYDVTAIVYYPSDNATWSDTVKQDYYGDIKWKEDANSVNKGDITGDGRINVGDVSKLYAHVKKTAPLPDTALAHADLTGDGRINIGDVSKLYAYVKKPSSSL